MSEKKTKTMLGRFEITKKIGRGYQGTVYLAFDPILQRKVAIKLLHECAKEETQLEQQLIEGRNIAQLHHPNIISLYEAGVYQDRLYLVFEYVKGNTLRQEFEKHTGLNLKRSLSIMENVLAGLAHAHQRGIIHLDLNPSNIMLDENGVARVMDFGLSRHTEYLFESTGTFTGTPRYVSPEHLRPEKLLPQSDVFSTALILYETLIGKPLLSGTTLKEIFEQISNSSFDFTEANEKDLPSTMLALLDKALANKPENRYVNAAEMLDSFRESCAQILSSRSTNDKHSTIDFLLRRMKRNQDFPALSNNLLTINKMTADNSKVSTAKLANFILRDYSITNKLLKLANSSFYRNFSGKVTNVSRAITILGISQVKIACNSLMLFDRMSRKAHHPYLRDSLIHSFISGLIARHLATAIKTIDAEEAFICGMLHNLGRTLAIYYFIEDYEEMLSIAKELGITNESAAEIVFGLKLSEIGQAVAEEWQFPTPIIASMKPLDNVVAEATAKEEKVDPLRRLAALSNTLADIATIDENADHTRLYAIAYFADPLIKLDANYLFSLINAAHERFEKFSPLLGLTTTNSNYLEKLREWLANNIPQEREAVSA